MSQTTTAPPMTSAAAPIGRLSRRRRDSRIVTTLVLADVLSLVLAVAAAFLVRQYLLPTAPDLGEHVLDAALPLALSWLIAIAAMNGYDARLVPTGPELFRTVLHATLVASGLVAVFVYLADVALSRAFFLAFFLIGPPLLLLNRLAQRRITNHRRVRGYGRESVIAVGNTTDIRGVVCTIHRESWLGYDIIGALTPGGAGQIDTGGEQVPVLGALEDIMDVVHEHQPAVLLFTSSTGASARDFRRLGWELENLDVQVIVVPALSEIAADRVRMRPVAGLPLVHMDLPRARGALQWIKRTFDVVVSAVALLLLAPVLAAIAIAVRFDDGGPVIFRQQRIGRNGQPFEFLKFRSMVTDAEAVLEEMRKFEQQDMGNDIMFKMRKDPRVTAPGRFLRRYSLDELPQLWNVLRGDMSLVGPRPALPREVAAYDNDALRRLHVKPGITGLWQVSGRSELSWEDTVRLDLYYVDNWSFTQDVQILARTIRAVLTSHGAY
jgi:exopolysaccharide biosynthesis polyprenyl glycosylphosphotransferase